MQTLSKAAEEQIISAARSAVNLVDSGGLTPDAAIEKLAREHGFGANKIRFLAHAYNTGRQTAQRHEAGDALGKFASFPLANAEAVVSAVYPPKEAVVKAATDLGVSHDYALPPAWLSLRDEQSRQARLQPHREKAAAAAATQATAVLPCKSRDVVYNEHLQFKRAAETARTKAGQAYDQLLGAMGGLADYFKRLPTDREPFYKCAYVVDTYFGQAGHALMGWVADRNRQHKREPAPPTEKAGLDAWTAKMRRQVIRFDPAVEPYASVGRCLKLACDVKAARDADAATADALEKHAIEELAPFVSAPKILKRASDSIIPEHDVPYYDADSVAPFLPHRQKQATVFSITSQPEKKAAWSILDGVEKGAGNVANWATGTAVGMGTRGLIEKTLGRPQDPAEQVHDAYVDLEDPSHDAQLRQIRSQALIADMMNDDVIGGHDPEDVMRAYNEISAAAPRTAEQPIALRSLLRHHLQSNLEPHEAQQMTQIESGLMGTHRPVPQQLEPLPHAKPAAAPQPKFASHPYRIIEDDPAANDSILIGA